LVLGHLVLFVVLVVTTAAVLCGHRSEGRSVAAAGETPALPAVVAFCSRAAQPQ